MPRPAASASPAAAGASSVSTEGNPTSIHPRDAAQVTANGTAAIVHARVAHPRRQPRPITSARAPATRNAQPRGAAPSDPVSNRKIWPSDSEPAPAGSTAAKPDQSPRGLKTPSDHGRLRTSATTTPPTATPRARHAPRHPPASTHASTKHSAVMSTSTTTNGTIATATATISPSPSTSDFHRDRSGCGNGASPTREREAQEDPWHDGVRDEAVPAAVAQRVVGQRDGGVGDERGDAGAHTADRRGEAPDADQPDQEGQQREQGVQQPHVSEERDRADADQGEGRWRCRRGAESDRPPAGAE